MVRRAMVSAALVVAAVGGVVFSGAAQASPKVFWWDNGYWQDQATCVWYKDDAAGSGNYMVQPSGPTCFFDARWGYYYKTADLS
ncbi:hypothetical protein [Actinosynnema sp. NPDC020468]|uniref:hypothetical protein n=1 Tax=Actinosynnema sp. NPDC020468 TaxID=3154488 RepID=UPI0033C4CFF2